MKLSVKNLVPLLLMIWATQLFIANITTSFASSLYDVVINEVAWAGSLDHANDEFIELYNNTNSEIDLSGWYIEDDVATIYTISSGKIPAKGFFLIEKSEEVVSNIQSDIILSLSLANTGDSLVLKNPSATIIDAVNTSGGMWPAGSNTSKATMERINPLESGDNPSNWASAVSSNGSVSSLSSPILGTPKSINSNTMSTGMEIVVNPSSQTASLGDTKTFSVNILDAENLYAYGFEVIFDPLKLEYISTAEGSFLKKDGKNASFMSSLENNTQGKLLVASSRLENPPTGVDGDGTLFTMSFKVIGDIGQTASLVFGPDSFLSDVEGQKTAKFNSASINPVGSIPGSAVLNAKVENGQNVYSLKVLWTAPSGGAQNYLLSRKMPDGNFVSIGQTSETNIINESFVATGISYEYRIVAVNNGVQGTAVVVSGTEERGIRGDIDKNKRVDGRDLEKLARTYGELYAQQNYNLDADLNYDGIIDGQDLIILGANFGLTY